MRDLLEPLERDSTVDRVARAIREGTVGGRIEPGTQIRISAFASMLQTSQGSVREAIRELVSEGLVEHRPHKGAFVRVRSEADSLDVYVAREAIEMWAVARLVQSTEEMDLTPLHDAVVAMQSNDGQPDDVVINADMHFHHTLVRLAGSERLTAVHEGLLAETRILVREHSPWPGASYEPLHLQILDAVRKHDPAAPELVRHHLHMASQLITGPSQEVEEL